MHRQQKTHRPLEIGVTGGIGSGKSVVCKIFSCFSIPVYDADSQAKRIMTSEPTLIEQIKKEVGITPVDEMGKLNKSALRSLFGQADQLEKLNKLVHPRVLLDYKKWKEQQQKKHYVIKEAALLIEAEIPKQLDRLIVVSAPLPLRIKRVLNRDKHRNKQEVLNIIDRQTTEEERVKHADHVITNDEIQPVIPQVWKLHQLFMSIQS